MEHCDVVILGGGPAGERAAVQAVRAGKDVLIIEREHVIGGTCINWGTIPSKTLRESALFVRSLTRNKVEGIRTEIAEAITIGDFMYRERKVVQRELELINQTLDRYRVRVIEGHGRFVDPHTIAVLGRDSRERLRVSGDVILIATGSSPNHPDDVPFDRQTVFDSDTVLHLPRMPRSMIVMGAGVVGVEYGSIFAALGLHVTLVDTRPELLPYLDREIAGILERELEGLGIERLGADGYQRIETTDGRRVRCILTSGRVLEEDVLLFCVGRNGNTRDLGLETVGIEPTSRGLIEVNEFYQTIHPHIYAVGDVIGYPALASTSMEQGRQAIRHAFDIPGPKGRTQVLPFALYSIPEVSTLGETEEQLVTRGTDYVVGRGRYDYNPRGQILGETGGLLKILFDIESMRILGVHVIGPAASELIHIGQAFFYGGVDAGKIAETLYNYPTLSDLYRHAALEGLAAKRRKLAAQGQTEPIRSGP